MTPGHSVGEIADPGTDRRRARIPRITLHSTPSPTPAHDSGAGSGSWLNVTAGSVVSLHLGHPGTSEALPGLLDDLADRRLSPVTAGTLGVAESQGLSATLP